MKNDIFLFDVTITSLPVTFSLASVGCYGSSASVHQGCTFPLKGMLMLLWGPTLNASFSFSYSVEEDNATDSIAICLHLQTSCGFQRLRPSLHMYFGQASYLARMCRSHSHPISPLNFTSARVVLLKGRGIG